MTQTTQATDQKKSESSLGFGSMGNGIIVWDRKRERNRDYLTVAHITKTQINYREKVSATQRAEIEAFAKQYQQSSEA